MPGGRTPTKGPTLGTPEIQAEIDAEQAYVSRLYAHLDELRAGAAGALDEVRRAPLIPTPAGRAERDAFDAWHSERVRQLNAVEDRLMFGRLDLDDGQRRYVGRIGLSDDERRQLLVDWRAPAAAAFYQATAASPAGVVRRRHIATRSRQVTGIDDELLDVEALERLRASGHGDEITTIAGEGALMSALTAHRTGRMKDIVATLQAEQDAVVRAPLPGVLVVQGGPGTGKTAVALHRAAYLLYTHRDRIARSGVLVVGPSPVFLRYIEQVLPSLGETGVLLATPGELFTGLATNLRDRDAVAVLKGDLRMASVVRNAVRLRQRVPNDRVSLVLDGDQVWLRPRTVVDARSRARQSGKPHNEARVIFVEHVLDDLARQLAGSRGLDLGDDGNKADLLDELRASRDVRREVNLCWLPLSATGLLEKLFARPDRLAAAAERVLSPAEQRLLFREPGAQWTVSDVPLLDEAAELIGPDMATFAADDQKRRDRAEALEYARAVLDTAGDASQMLTPEMLADRFAGGGPLRTLAERAAEDRAWTFGHAVVDEAQELSPMQWRLLVRRVPSRSMTVVGDVAQTGSAAGTSAWADVLDKLADDRWRLAELTVNYRTPRLVMEVAASLLAAHGVAAKAPNSARDGDFPPAGHVLAGGDAASIGAGVARAVTDDEAAVGGGRFAVVLPRTGFAAAAAAVHSALPEALAGRTDVMTVDDAKGLEFDAVTVVDPAAIIAESHRGVNDLYVALTRPTQRLTVLHHGTVPAGLEGLAEA